MEKITLIELPRSCRIRYVVHLQEASWLLKKKNDRPGSEISGYHKRVIDHPANSPPVSKRNQQKEEEGMNGNRHVFMK